MTDQNQANVLEELEVLAVWHELCETNDDCTVTISLPKSVKDEIRRITHLSPIQASTMFYIANKIDLSNIQYPEITDGCVKISHDAQKLLMIAKLYQESMQNAAKEIDVDQNKPCIPLIVGEKKVSEIIPKRIKVDSGENISTYHIDDSFYALKTRFQVE